MKMKVHVSLDMFRRGGEVIEEAVGETVREVAEAIKEEAQRNAPKRSGELKQSIRILDINKRSAKIGSDLIYAAIHEFGGTIRPNKGETMRFRIGGRWVTIRGTTIKGSHYLGRAADTVNKRVPEIAERVMREKGFR